MRRCWVLVAVLAAGLVGLSALAQEAGRDRPQRGRDRAGRDRTRGMDRTRGGFVSLNVRGLSAVTDLSEDQRKQIEEIRRAALQKVQEIQKQMEQDVRKVLTPEQLKKLEDAQRQAALRGPDGVTLTPEQRAILDQARADAAKVDDREARMKIMREAQEKVRASYTEEQKKQAEEARARRGRGRRPGGQPGGGGG